MNCEILTNRSIFVWEMQINRRYRKSGGDSKPSDVGDLAYFGGRPHQTPSTSSLLNMEGMLTCYVSGGSNSSNNRWIKRIMSVTSRDWLVRLELCTAPATRTSEFWSVSRMLIT